LSKEEEYKDMTALKVGIVTKEWPPAIYGGAGVHVLQLTQALRTIKDVHVDVHCFGGKRDDAFGYSLVLQMQIQRFKL
jgi:starch synthase